ncbi:MAG TPA: NADPH:quinone oxidoreductase family protein [Burkholderiaceae bacterium]|nr:NADPH:quinone oxidoreductase family protein [Burkholderiaceae bacterium]
MKALVCSAFGPIENLSVQTVDTPVIRPDQVLVNVAAASVNFPDALMVQGLYQHKPPFPFSPGVELSGVVAEVGTDVDGWKVGDRVMASVDHGGFAEQCAAAPHRLIPLPDGISFAQGAGFVLTFGTALHALQDRARITSADTVLILGAAGGVGVAAIQVAKQLGARVIAAASTQDKISLCRELGADEVINYSTHDLREQLKALTDNRGVNVVLDSIGGDHSEAALRSLDWRGRYLVVGFAAGTIPRLPLNLVLLKERDIMGVFWGDAVRRDKARHLENMQTLRRWLQEKRIAPFIDEEVGLDDAAAAIARVANRQVKGKVVIQIGGI